MSPLGPIIRGYFGRHERWITDIYRALYLDVSDLVGLIHRWIPQTENVLEVGCGEGAVTTKLRVTYPQASITAIDISPRVGRLYQGSRERVEFRQCTVQQIQSERPAAFDLVILSDVLHHVPPAMQSDLLVSLRGTLRPGGTLVFKEWERARTYWPIYWICYASDRWLTGDRVRYMSSGEIDAHLVRTFGREALIARAFVRPWRNNVATLIRPNQDGAASGYGSQTDADHPKPDQRDPRPLQRSQRLVVDQPCG